MTRFETGERIAGDTGAGFPQRRTTWSRGSGSRRLAAALLASACAVGAAASATPAEAGTPPSCGALYTIARGDTLFQVAKRAYGDGWQYKKIFEANRDLLPDEKSVEIGDQLLVPCLDGSAPQTRREVMQSAAAPALPEQAAADMTAADMTAPAPEPQAPVETVAAGAAEAVRPEAVRPEACFAEHTVAVGDTLFLIAQKAYGDGWKYKEIFQANRDLLPNEASVELGSTLLIPCLDGTGPRTRREAVAAGLMSEPVDIGSASDPAPAFAGAIAGLQASENPDAAPDVALPAFDTLTADLRMPAPPAIAGWPGLASPEAMADLTTGLAAASVAAAGETAEPVGPVVQQAQDDVSATALLDQASVRFVARTTPDGFAFPAQIGGGVAVTIVAQSLAAANPEQPFTLASVSDRAGYLRLLVDQGSFDVSFPWYMPDCAAGDRLDWQARTLCAEFEFSRPLAQVPLVFYTRLDSPLAGVTSIAELAGKRICRPSSGFADDLDLGALARLEGTIERPGTAIDCFADLIAGKVDVVSLVGFHADEEVARLQIDNAVAAIPALTGIQTLHAIAPKSNRRGLAYLALVNRGLESIMLSGKWFEVITEFENRHEALNG